MVDVYVFRRAADGTVEFLQMLRALGGTLGDTWQPVMGHAETWETAVQCALRELEEETGLKRESEQFLGFWALEQVHPYYLAGEDVVMMSPRFAAEAGASWEVKLNAEHTMLRWVPQGAIDEHFMWPGQRAAAREVLTEVVAVGSLSRDRIKIEHAGVKR